MLQSQTLHTLPRYTLEAMVELLADKLGFQAYAYRLAMDTCCWTLKHQVFKKCVYLPI